MSRLSQVTSLSVSRPGMLAAVAGLLVGATVVACTSGDDFLPTYGNANGLQGMSPGKTAAALADDAGGAGGCVAGSTPDLYIDAGTCTVSFSKDIEGYITSPTEWNCTNSSCHGAGAQMPPIVGNAAVDYPVLVAYETGFLRPYINPCSTDPGASSITCNIDPTMNSCDGQLVMPETVGGNHQATQAQLDTVSTWLKCGAPNN